eukprot:2583705-Lingulodinium_polyedra.AAC.1
MRGAKTAERDGEAVCSLEVKTSNWLRGKRSTSRALWHNLLAQRDIGTLLHDRDPTRTAFFPPRGPNTELLIELNRSPNQTFLVAGPRDVVHMDGEGHTHI